MNDDNQYTPISCELYSRLELHIMHKDSLRMQWRESDTIIHVEPVEPYDLQTIKDNGEFIFVRNAEGKDVKIRLDRIIRFEKLS